LQDPISKKPNTKRAGGMAQGVGPEFKPQYCKKKKTTYSTQKKADGVAQVTEYLLSKHGA
jgi:hypothetical protein